jgi:hypothetical protein
MNTSTNTNDFKHIFANLSFSNSWISNKPTNAPRYTYSFGSLNGTVCFGRAINSMVKIVEYETGIRIEKTNIYDNELDEPDPDEYDKEIQKELIENAESWTSMRMMHVYTIDYRIDDDRVNSYEQIHSPRMSPTPAWTSWSYTSLLIESLLWAVWTALAIFFG